MSFRLCCVIAAITLASALPAQAQIGFILGRNGAKLSAEDMTTIRGSVRQVLTSNQVGKTETWTASGNARGETTLSRIFESDGEPCGEVRIVIRRPERETPYTMNFCRSSDGQWLIAP